MKGMLSMRKLKEILRLDASGLSQRKIARSLVISVGVVNKYLALAREAQITWPLEEELLNDKVLKQRLFYHKVRTQAPKTFTPPDCEWIHREKKHKGVTLHLLHEDYKKQTPDSFYQYTQFCDIYYKWKKHQKLSCRQEHKAGEHLEVDYAGLTVPLINITLAFKY